MKHTFILFALTTSLVHLCAMDNQQLSEKIDRFLQEGVTTDQRYEMIPQLLQEIDSYSRNQGPAHAHAFVIHKQRLTQEAHHYFLSKQTTSIHANEQWLKQLSIGCLEKIVASVTHIRELEDNDRLYEELRFNASQEYKSRLSAHKYK